MRADLPHLEQAEARKWASLARLLVRDMLAAHRLELGVARNWGWLARLPVRDLVATHGLGLGRVEVAVGGGGGGA